MPLASNNSHFITIEAIEQLRFAICIEYTVCMWIKLDIIMYPHFYKEATLALNLA